MTNSTQLSTYNFESHSIRTIAINNEPWFVAVDVCNALNIANSRDALLKLDEDEKTTVGLTDSQAGNGAQSLSLVSESGMYTLILRCRDAVKKGSVPHRFRKWVTAEVLPQIRRTGKYAIQLPEPDPTINIELTMNEWRNLINVWTLFTRYEESVSLLLKAAAPFIHGHPFSFVQFNQSRSKSALSETVPTIKKIMEKLPKAVKFHESREQISHKYGF
jgi:putative uncharacterized protein (fragment)|uniref:Repressor domain protein n=1 Tax=Podoviridae sp. ct4s49 TaxID=2823555 RepID=A0A8S5LE99_9CAUD|nr:MAG TPA: repressor domain protein [Podoviridae sp. ct4s49]